MGMGDENVGDSLVTHGIEQRFDMGVVIGTGVEDCDLAAADDVTHRALEGKRPRIIGDHRAHARRDLCHSVGLEIESLVEGMSSLMQQSHVSLDRFSFVQPCFEPDRVQSDFALPERATAIPILPSSLSIGPLLQHGVECQLDDRGIEQTAVLDIVVYGPR